MTETIQSTDLRRRVREVLERVQREQEPLIVRTYGSAQAVLIPIEQFKAYQTWLERRQKRTAWLAELRSIAEEVSARAGLTDEEVVALIDEAVGAEGAPPQPSAP